MPLRKIIPSFILLALSLTATAAPVVEGVRAWAEQDSTRIVLDLSANASHNLFTLRQPNRVVIDIAGGELGDLQQALPENVGVVRNVRIAQRGARDLRIVLDLDSAVQARSFYAGPARGSAQRLVIDLGARARASSVKRIESKERDIVIAVDPGHGGRDPGAIGKHKTREKDVVLAIGKRLVKQLNDEPGFSAFLVRDKDVLIEHRERLEAARKANADLFVSIHADAVDDRRARGSSVYVLSVKGASDETARRLAARQNASLIGGVDLSEGDPVLASVLMDLSMNATINASLDIGDYVLAQLGKVNKLHRRTVQQAGFLVLKSPDVPSILVETAYISNPDEERNLASSNHQKKLSNAIFQGIRQFFTDNPPADTLIAKRVRERPRQARTYTIGPGDTLSEIADRHRVSLGQLRRENRLSNDRIRVGQILRIPGGG
ncbi:MAG: N-acetylmuramoyl-L-alanine amidase [Woeseiaceae bacterium]